MSSLALLTGSDFGPGDPKQEHAIAERRRMESDRLRRIKDPKSRIMGIDSGALAAQVLEKRAAALAEGQLRLDYDTQRLQQDAQLAYLEQERLRAERTKMQYLDEFRRTEQGKETSREFDLNDPLSKLHDLPARASDGDLRLSVSGMQQFHGEDLSYAHRVKIQQDELKAWSEEVRLWIAPAAFAQAHARITARGANLGKQHPRGCLCCRKSSPVPCDADDGEQDRGEGTGSV